ncbi:MAG TPA: MmcQ/YjbR family DNA-binding protein [Tenuifilaceae bacterium]|nr:MmcQ/YjbR family DNA-binding protein [Tenuifilaceae bacterium]HPE18889.1 MmcQ/YjbR family DNA-binding protein [Tenuifilaceae bacterium]HPJ45110.1 MmcQ/YjbR family DNA-binding protein [Tenuifilaceae bacterium]HPQ33710.1 MmcQ/YjbR family DNA-binding protein [Tenuifilaceae bacterium]HRX68069.1 MmcQ/YjbR family DNA-binding protein [Tenuifilaceae bacterium]
MNIEELREYCLSLAGTSESFPFDDVTLVFKVGGKMFALVSLDGDLAVNLKCDPDVALELREQYPAVVPGYHMNKKNWNTVYVDGSIPDSRIRQWIYNSYSLVRSSLPKKTKDLLND